MSIFILAGKNSPFEVFPFFDPQNLSKTSQTGGGSIQATFPDILSAYEKSGFCAFSGPLGFSKSTILTKNGSKWSNDYFWPFLRCQSWRKPLKHIEFIHQTLGGYPLSLFSNIIPGMKLLGGSLG